MKHSLRACIKNTAKTTMICTMIMLTACSTIPANSAQSSSDKKMVCNLSAAAICENANYNSDNFNEDLLACIKDNNSGDGRSHIAKPTVGDRIGEYTVVGAAIILYTGLLILDHNVSSHPHR